MSLLSPTRIKAMPINERMEVVTNASVATFVDVPVEIQKDLTLVIVNTNTSADYAGATLAITGTNLSKVGSNWLSSKAGPLFAGELTGNTIALKRGTTTLNIAASSLAEYSSLRLTATGTADSRLYVYVVWNDQAAVSDWITLSASIPLNRTKTTEKNWKITVIPKGVDASNLVRIALTTTGGVWSSSLLQTKDPQTGSGNYVYVTAPTEFYVNDIYNIAELNLSITCTGAATAAVIVEASNTPADLSEFYKRLFEVTASIGDAYFFSPNNKAQYVLCRIDSTIAAGGSATVYLSPRDRDGVSAGVKFGEFGSSAEASNSINISASGSRYLYLRRSSVIARVHASCTITGAGNTVRVSFADHFGELAVSEVAGAAVQAPYYAGDGFSVDLHRTAKNFAAYENWWASVSTLDVLTVSNGSTSSEVALTALPGWKTGDSVGAMGFIPYRQGGPESSNYSRETAMRLCFFTRLGNVYHNYPAAAADDKTTNGGMGAFDLSAIYEPIYRVSDNTVLSSERIPSTNAALTAEEKKLYRYQPGLPAWNYEQHTNNIGGLKADGSAYGSGGLPPVLEKNGIKLIRMVTPFDYGTNPQDSSKPFQMSGNLSSPFSVKSKCTVFTPYNGVNISKNVVLGTVDGGRIWVVLHELGSTSNLSSYGNNFDYSAIGSYTSGALSVVRRTYIQPTASVKDPTNCFQYADPISVTAITTTAGKASISTAAAHGFATGDLICFKKNSAGNYDFLENSVTAGNAAAFASNSAGDGRFYRVKVTGTTTFELLQNYNGLDEKIGTHHIHSANPAKDGHVICCGEKYPAGWILFVRVPQIDDFEFFDPYTYRVLNRYIYRLNSSATAMQRAVGMVWNDDKDHSFLFASDEQNIGPRPLTIAGRDAAALPLRNTAGVFKGKISDIDDITLAEVVCEMEEASLGLVNAQGMYVVLGMSRKTYLSQDAAKWVSFPMIARYVGESNGAIYLLAGTSVYKVTKL